MSAKMSESTNALNWFEIPVTNMDRAKQFYETIFDIKMTSMEMMGMKMSMFPPTGASRNVGGALVKSNMHVPGVTGCVVYLNANPDLQLVADRIENAGGKIEMPKMLIDEQTGHMAFFMDTEGNKIGLHSNN